MPKASRPASAASIKSRCPGRNRRTPNRRAASPAMPDQSMALVISPTLRRDNGSGDRLEQRGDGLGALLRRLLHLRQVADLEIGLRLVGEAVPLAEQKERIEAARITAGASEPQLPVADGLSEVASVRRAIRGGAEARQKAHNDRTALRRK